MQCGGRLNRRMVTGLESEKMSGPRAYANLWQQILKDACWEALHGLGFVSVVVTGLTLGSFSRYASSDESLFDQAEWLHASACATAVVGVALFIVGGVKAIRGRAMRLSSYSGPGLSSCTTLNVHPANGTESNTDICGSGSETAVVLRAARPRFGWIALMTTKGRQVCSSRPGCSGWICRA
jgi:hypothetical protein